MWVVTTHLGTAKRKHYVDPNGLLTPCQCLAKKHETRIAAEAIAYQTHDGRVLRLIPSEKARLKEALRTAIKALLWYRRHAMQYSDRPPSWVYEAWMQCEAALSSSCKTEKGSK